MKAVLYARSACLTLGTESPLEPQLEALRNQAARQGMEIIAEFRDAGYSGLHLTRPGLDRMRELAKRSGFDVLLTCGPDRLARDSVLLDRILQELTQLGIRTHFLEDLGRHEEPAWRMRPVVPARAELEVRVTARAEARLGCGLHAAVRTAESDAIDSPRRRLVPAHGR